MCHIPHSFYRTKIISKNVRNSENEEQKIQIFTTDILIL
jgi:hypothetical protein